MIKIAVYGKGGIGKSTTISNLSVALSKKGLKVMQIGCDPKADSTTNLHNGSEINTVLDLVRKKKDDFELNEMVVEGYNGILCVEAGGPTPGMGCAGRGIITALEKLEQKGAYEAYKPDIVFYDVLGDVVCGGFSMPMRCGYADKIFIITSGEYMSLHAALNIATAIDNFKNRGYATLGGVILNKRNIKNQILTNSADQAFKGATGIGKYGFFILNLEMPANYYDVNVHPTKMEVRFNDEDKLYKVFYHAIKSAMLNSEFLDNNEKEQKKENYIENELQFLTNRFKNETPAELINRENKREIEYKYIGILFRTFIVIEIGNDMFLIDQHAGHERILYEQIKENYKNHIQNNSQLMLIPEVFNLSHKEIEFVKENIELFRNTGFDIELFGEDSVKISGIPDIEYKVNKNRMFLDVLDEMITTERTAIKDVEERFIATVACKAAVKANMDLTRQEVDNLIQRLLKLKNPFTCPHGRPTTIKFSKEELFKK